MTAGQMASASRGPQPQTTGQKLLAERGRGPRTTGQILQDARDAGHANPHAAVAASGVLHPGKTVKGITAAYDYSNARKTP
jgi:hypothetical protein